MGRPRVLLLGGHGKISLLMIPLMLARSWHVISVVRNPEHSREIQDLGSGQPGKLEVLVESLEHVKTAQDAGKVIDRTKPDYIVWSAGAGGKGGAERTFAVDRDAAKAYIEAGVNNPGVKKFLMISYVSQSIGLSFVKIIIRANSEVCLRDVRQIASRRNRPSWWTDEDWTAAQEINTKTLANYFKAKVDADEHLVAWAEKRRREGDAAFQAIDLRPGTLTDDRATGKVLLGHTPSRGKVTRADVADVAVRLLERHDTRGYYDLLEGQEDTQSAVQRVASEKTDSLEGEDLDTIYKLVT